jgi:hypothetical protein
MEHLDFLDQLMQLIYLLKNEFFKYKKNFLTFCLLLPGPASLQSTVKYVGIFILTPRSTPGP